MEVQRVGHYLLLALLFAAGLLSKSVVVTLPLALLIVQWWRGGRVTRLELLRVVLGAAVAAADLAFYRGRNPLELDYTLAERMLAERWRSAAWMRAVSSVAENGLTI